jgi:hypothetical protein
LYFCEIGDNNIRSDKFCKFYEIKNYYFKKVVNEKNIGTIIPLSQREIGLLSASNYLQLRRCTPPFSFTRYVGKARPQIAKIE